MLMRNFSCCGARCIVRPLSACALSLWLTHAAPQLPDDEEEDTGGALSGALSRGDLLRMARDASVYLGALKTVAATQFAVDALGRPYSAILASIEC